MKQKNNSRTFLAFRNVIVTTFVMILNFPIQFVNRYFMVRYLGITYLGLTSLFSNILSVLSLADLGIGTSIVFLLYKPLAVKDIKKISIIMKYYRRIYQAIAVVIFGLGLIILPFLHYFIGSKINYPNVYLLFLIYLLGSASSYLFSYNQSLLYADQKNHIVSWISLFVTYIMLIAQIISVVTTKNSILYALLYVFSGFITNLIVTIYVNKLYKFNWKIKDKLERKEKMLLIHNVIGNMFLRVSGVIVTATDNIFLSAFAGVNAVGFYANYVTIVNVIQKIITQAIGSVTGSIGNFIIQKKVGESKKLFFDLQFINFIFVSMASLGIYFVCDDVISIWLGSKFVIDRLDVLLIALSFYFMNYRMVGWNFISVYGLAQFMKVFSINEIIANLGFTFVFLYFFKLKLTGVLLGTICSTLFTVTWQDPYIIFRHAFNTAPWEYYIKYIYNILILGIEYLILNNIFMFINQTKQILIIRICLKAFIVVFASIGLPYLFYLKQHETKYLRELFFKLIRGVRSDT